MAEKKKIKGIKDNPGDGGSITVNSIDPKGNLGPDEVFNQPNYKGLCFNVGDIINTESVLIGGVSTIVIARRITRGTVLTIGADGISGTIEENRSKKTINFLQPNLKGIGIIATSEVNYDLTPDMTNGGEVAVNVALLA